MRTRSITVQPDCMIQSCFKTTTSEHLVWLTDLPYDPKEVLVQQSLAVNAQKPV